VNGSDVGLWDFLGFVKEGSVHIQG